MNLIHNLQTIRAGDWTITRKNNPSSSSSSKRFSAFPTKQSSKGLRGTIRATHNMISFNNFPWRVLFVGVIGVALGAMLRRKIFGDQEPEREQAEDEHEEEDRDRGAPDMRLHQEAILRLHRREPVEHDYIPEI